RIYGTDAAAEVERVFTGKRSSVQIACEIRGSRDSRPFKLDVRRLVGADRKLVVVLASFADEHPYLGDCDPLTGLPNRQAARRQAEAWQAPSAGPSTPFAVLFVDLDEFKRINDQFGHSQGDEVLRVLAERWQHCVRDDDLVVRYGGDEFLMLISGVTTPTEAQPIVSRVCAETSRPIVTKAAEFRVTASVGVAFSQQPSESFDAVVDEADRQMYARRRSACHPPRPPR
ncbi:MAG: GGDEF domain-containing protein, partial [Planctomycetota bacterium]